jgi:NTP pyrophosphatase (non-canonical NTP hydrolase)
MSEFSELVRRANRIRQLYAEFEKTRYGRLWTREEIMLGFVGDVGDLSKLIQANEGVRQIDDAKDKLAHELSDCLWSIMVLADLYEVDLEAEFMRTMDEIEQAITNEDSAE